MFPPAARDCGRYSSGRSAAEPPQAAELPYLLRQLAGSGGRQARYVGNADTAQAMILPRLLEALPQAALVPNDQFRHAGLHDALILTRGRSRAGPSCIRRTVAFAESTRRVEDAPQRRALPAVSPGRFI